MKTWLKQKLDLDSWQVFWRAYRTRRRSWLTLLVVSGIAVVVGVVSVSSYLLIRQVLLEKLQENAMLKLQQGQEQTDSWLKGQKRTLEAIAQTPMVQTGEWEEAEDYLQQMQQQHPEFLTIALIDQEGNFQSTRGKMGNVRDREHFQEAIAGETYVSDPLISRVSELPVIVIDTPVSASDSPDSIVGTVGVTIPIESVALTVEQIHYGEGSYAFAINSEGVPIVHPDPDRMGTLEEPAPSLFASEDANLRSLALNMVSDQQEIIRTQLEGEVVYVAYFPLQEANWSLALVIPQQTLEQGLWALNIMASVVGILLVIALYAVARVALVSEQRRSQVEQEALLNRLIRRIRASLDIDQILQTTVHELGNLLKIDRVLFCWYRDETLQVQRAYCRLQQDLLGGYQTTDVEALKFILARGDAIELQPIETESNPDNEPIVLKENGYLALPVSGDKQGYLICYHRHRNWWTEADREVLQAVADQLAIAITQAGSLNLL
ncbi:MAG: GAF domain-containing protein [Kamptonema sp. SIO4C4]|nr:GAF domain-containing protein [Kamptonema sp. SIO4C4]